jgi:hypothetical protein
MQEERMGGEKRKGRRRKKAGENPDLFWSLFGFLGCHSLAPAERLFINHFLLIAFYSRLNVEAEPSRYIIRGRD